MEFNSGQSKILLLDINSCFATIEQQANPLLRGKPIAVCAYTTSKGTILAASVEAKKLGIKTGMRVFEARSIYPKITVLPPDPPKYRFVHNKLQKLLLRYSPQVEPKSIDEFIVELETENLMQKAIDIKKRIRKEIGEWITVSIGLAPNRYLAKVAAGLVKPDGLVEINKNNYQKVYESLQLMDLTGIKEGNNRRLNRVGIQSVMDFYNAPYDRLKIGLKKAAAHSWYLRLRGYEIDAIPWGRKSFGNEVAIKLAKKSDAIPIIARLFEKASARARKNGFRAKKRRVDISQYKIAVTLFDLVDSSSLQLDLFDESLKKENLDQAIDKINNKWGNFVVGSAQGFKAREIVKDRIAFHHLP